MIYIIDSYSREKVYFDPHQVEYVEPWDRAATTGNFTIRCTRIHLNSGRDLLVDEETEVIADMVEAARLLP